MRRTGGCITTNRTMRGNDYMSASSKKKLRKEQNAAAMTEKQQKELKDICGRMLLSQKHPPAPSRKPIGEMNRRF